MPGIPSYSTVEKQEGQRGEVTLPKVTQQIQDRGGIRTQAVFSSFSSHPHPQTHLAGEKLRTGWLAWGMISALSPSPGRVPEIAQVEWKGAGRFLT